MELPVDTHIEMWATAAPKMLTQSAYAALLVSMHGTALQSRRDLALLEPGRRELVTSYLADDRAFQSELIDRLGADREQVARNQRLVWAWDGISLAACLGWETLLEEVPGTGGPVEIEVRAAGEGRLVVAPWPFTDSRLTVRCEGRWLSGRFGTEPELHDALAHAPLVELEFALEPG
jgi:hypothetical protein